MRPRGFRPVPPKPPKPPTVELEPIGPRERLKPGESASFTEEWLLLPHPFPKDGEKVESVTERVRRTMEMARRRKAGEKDW